MKIKSEMAIFIIRTLALNKGRTTFFFLSSHNFSTLGIRNFIAYIGSFQAAVNIFFVILMIKQGKDDSSEPLRGYISSLPEIR